jgi:hypothetical protein
MRQRQWVLAMSVSMFAGLVSGCSHMRSRGVPAGPAQDYATPADPAPIVQAEPAAKSGISESQNIKQTQLTAAPNGQEQQIPPPSWPVRSENPSGVRTRTAVSVQPTAKAPAPEDPPLVCALRCYLNKKPAEAVIWLDRHERLNQDFLLCLLPLAARLSEGGLQKADPRDLANVVVQLDRLAGLIRPAAELLIDKMCFCDKIERFGVYHPLDEEHLFQPGELTQVYVELRNFSSVPKERESVQTYAVQLAFRAEIRKFRSLAGDPKAGGNGEVMWTELKTLQDLSKTPRTDFFINYPLWIPQVPPGHYILNFTVTDAPTKRKVERTLDLRIVAARGCAPHCREDAKREITLIPIENGK